MDLQGSSRSSVGQPRAASDTSDSYGSSRPRLNALRWPDDSSEFLDSPVSAIVFAAQGNSYLYVGEDGEPAFNDRTMWEIYLAIQRGVLVKVVMRRNFGCERATVTYHPRPRDQALAYDPLQGVLPIEGQAQRVPADPAIVEALSFRKNMSYPESISECDSWKASFITVPAKKGPLTVRHFVESILLRGQKAELREVSPGFSGVVKLREGFTSTRFYGDHKAAPNDSNFATSGATFIWTALVAADLEEAGFAAPMNTYEFIRYAERKQEQMSEEALRAGVHGANELNLPGPEDMSKLKRLIGRVYPDATALQDFIIGREHAIRDSDRRRSKGKQSNSGRGT